MKTQWMNLRQACLVTVTVLVAVMAPAAVGQELVVLSAPAYRNVVSADSVATAFGVDLSSETAHGVVNAAGLLPRKLADVVVSVDGRAAQLIYVSTWQINFVVPGGVDIGTAEVIVYLNDVIVATGSVLVEAVAPGFFASDGSGTGPGAIENSTTFSSGPWGTQTAQLPGCDKRTILTLYASGLRSAPEPQSMDLTLGGEPAPVEFFGASKLFPGVDEIRFTVPGEVSVAGSYELEATVDGVVSNTVSVEFAPNEASTLPCDDYGQAFVYNTVADLLAGDLWDTASTNQIFADLETVAPHWVLGGVGTTAIAARNGELIVNGMAGTPELVWSDPLFPPTVRTLVDEPTAFVGVGAGNPASMIRVDATPGVPIHQQIVELAAEHDLAFASIRVSGTFSPVGYTVARNLLKEGTPLTDPNVDKSPFQLFFTDNEGAEWQLSGFYAAGSSVQEIVSVFGAPVHLHGFRDDRTRAGHVGSAIVEEAVIELYPLDAPVVREADLAIRELGVEDGTISFEVTNEGYGTVTRATVQAISGESVVFQVELSDLARGEAHLVTVDLPSTVDIHDLEIVVDPFNDVGESNEANNSSYRREGLSFHLADKVPGQ